MATWIWLVLLWVALLVGFVAGGFVSGLGRISREEDKEQD